jgi:hypothetical protein
VDGKDEDFTHRAKPNIAASTRKTARRARTSSYCEFSTHRWLGGRRSETESAAAFSNYGLTPLAVEPDLNRSRSV